MNTTQQLRESIYCEALKKMVSIAYDRMDDLTIEELETTEYAAMICDSVYWMEIERALEKQY